MKKILIVTTLFFFCSCGIQNIPTYNYELKNPVDDFDFEKNSFDLDYDDPKIGHLDVMLVMKEKFFLRITKLKTKKKLIYQFFTYIQHHYFHHMTGTLTHLILLTMILFNYVLKIKHLCLRV